MPARAAGQPDRANTTPTSDALRRGEGTKRQQYTSGDHMTTCTTCTHVASVPPGSPVQAAATDPSPSLRAIGDGGRCAPYLDSEGLGLVCGDRSQMAQVAFVPDQHDHDVGVGVVPQLLQPAAAA